MTRRSGSNGRLAVDWLEQHPADAARLRVGGGDLVGGRSARGGIELPARVTASIAPGHVPPAIVPAP